MRGCRPNREYIAKFPMKRPMLDNMGPDNMPAANPNFNASNLTPILGAVLDAVIARSMMECNTQMACLKGLFAGESTSVNTRRWEDANGGTLIVSAMMVGVSVRGLTIVGLPSSRRSLPILGVDVATEGLDISLLAADIVPVSDDTFAVDNIMRAFARRTQSMKRRYLVTTNPSVFTSRAVVVSASAEHSASACDAVVKLLGSWSKLQPTTSPEASRIATQWCRSQRETRHEAKQWSSLFGPELVDDYLQNTMFPIVAGQSMI
jgi:hypothetical protein